MTELELQESLRKTRDENKARVMASLSAKIGGKKVEVTENTYESYEQAKQAGDIQAMLFFKTGGAEAQRREQEVEKVMNTDIKTVMSELNGIDDKISNIQSKLNTTIEQMTAQYDQEFRNNVRGLRSHEGRYMMALQEYNDKVANIHNVGVVKELSNAVQSSKERKALLSRSKEHYVKENERYISEARKAKIMAEIQNSVLLDDIG
jgi:cysteinyl-tRNA synthetase